MSHCTGRSWSLSKEEYSFYCSFSSEYRAQKAKEFTNCVHISQYFSSQPHSNLPCYKDELAVDRVAHAKEEADFDSLGCSQGTAL